MGSTVYKSTSHEMKLTETSKLEDIFSTRTLSWNAIKAGHGSSNDGFFLNIKNVFLPFSNTFVCLLSIKFTFITITYL